MQAMKMETHTLSFWDRLNASEGIRIRTGLRTLNLPDWEAHTRSSVSGGLSAYVAGMTDSLATCEEVVLGIAALGLNRHGELGQELVQGRPWLNRGTVFFQPDLWQRHIPALSQTSLRDRIALMAGFLTCWDHWDDAHNSAQTADDLGETAFSQYWHAILHRREPDDGNASYWLRRVGKHPVHHALVRELCQWSLNDDESALRNQLLPRGQWDPYAFVALCRDARKEPTNTPSHTFARKVQRLETALLLDATWRGIAQNTN